jgi:uncharacterized protein YdaU (DUF1376 family)
MNFYSFHIGDYRGATAHLTNDEDLAYRRLLDMYYDTERAIPLETQSVIRRLRLGSAAVETVLSDFFVRQDDGWHHARCDGLIIEYQKGAAKNRENGKKGGRPKAALSLENNPVGSHSVATGIPLATTWKGNQEPITINQEPKTNTIVSGDAADLIQIASTSKLTCPHQSIIDLYHAELPVCPRIKDWTPARQTHLRARWNEDAERQDLDYWQRLFGYIATCDFLVGKSGGTRPFFAGLEWIVKSENFAKIREGKYQNNENRSA